MMSLLVALNPMESSLAQYGASADNSEIADSPSGASDRVLKFRCRFADAGTMVAVLMVRF